MKTLVVGLICFVGAFIIARMAPQNEVNLRDARIEELEALLKDRARNRRALAGVTGMLHIDDQTVAVDEIPPSSEEGEGVVSVGNEPEQTREEGAEFPASKTMEERINAAAELWESRTDLARAAFLSNLEADDKMALDFDVLMKAMNLRVADTIEKWVDQIDARGFARPEDGARLMHELTGSVVFTYDELDRVLPGEWRDQGGDDFKLFDFVDPDAGRSLLRVEGLSEGAEGGPSR